MLDVADIQLISELAHEHGIILAVDSTFTTPYIVRPLLLGADLVMHSATKFIGGHSDVLQGLICTNCSDVHQKIRDYQRMMGNAPSPFESFLSIMGMKTLHIRMKNGSKNALKLAKFLESHPKVEFVRYPGLVSHEGYEYVRQFYKSAGSVITFRLKGGEDEMKRLFRSLKVLKVIYASLGGVKSMINDP